MINFHSVVLDSEKCCGCTNCIKRCPTEAIRVRGGKAVIQKERCIDCGQCIRVCPHHANKANADSFAELANFKYNIALPDPALFGQFNNLDELDIVLNGLLQLGFDGVFEASRGAELVSQATRELLHQDGVVRPLISSSCPAVLRLIKLRFPDLCENVLPYKAPIEVAALEAKEEAHRKTGLSKSDIGVFLITPCPAKVTCIKNPSIEKGTSNCDGAIPISYVYPKLASAMDKLTELDDIAQSGIVGVTWAVSGGESSALLSDKYLAADGIENVIKVLEELEDEHIRDLDFIELNACSGGCVGGVLNVENPYVAQARIHRLRKYLPIYQNRYNKETDFEKVKRNYVLQSEAQVMSLSPDLFRAMEMMDEMEKIKRRLPQLDCGSCGAPSCSALAEDIVRGNAKESDCVIRLKRRLINNEGK
jgi:iron only hydrogenase large subunit-like protein